MTWTYESTAPGATAKDWVRLTLGDTSSADPLLQDEEITALITDNGNKYAAAAAGADAIAAKFARKADKRVGPLSIAASQMAKQYTALADRLRRKTARRVAPYAGGISVDDKRTNENDTDWAKGAFSVGLHDNPPLTLSTST